jgi:hypothetical protein
MNARILEAEQARAIPGGRLPDEVYAAAPWRIHTIAPDFQLEDVWELPGEGRPEDFRKLIEFLCRMDPETNATGLSKILWALRWKIGGILGWDDEDDGLDVRVKSIRERLPEDLRDTDPPAFATLPFVPLYITDNEFAAEVANSTMHGVMHLGAVPSPTDPELFRIQMAVLVKPNGITGKAYMMAIRPFRHYIVYPAMMRQGRTMWERLPA